MKPTLVVMAAGIGSRYGGLKQIEPIGPSGEIMMDYSVYDALRAGFGKIVFIIRHDIDADFKTAIGSRLARRAPIDYVFQELTDLPPGFTASPDRKKPWGTGHAVLLCKQAVKEPFGVINADDFYGQQSYVVLADFLKKASNTHPLYAMVGFSLINTLSDHGHVTRGICETNAQGLLSSVVERFKVEKHGGGARYATEDGGWQDLKGDEIASMNMFGFTPTFFDHLDALFPKFLKHAEGNLKAEFLLPTIVDQLIRAGTARMQVLSTPEKWFGVTYKQDKPEVMANIRKQIDAGIYPERLWA